VALVLIRSNAEQHEVPTLMAASCHMQREYPFTDLAPFFCTYRRRPGGQRHESSRKCIGIDSRQGEESGPSTPFDFEAFVARKRNEKPKTHDGPLRPITARSNRPWRYLGLHGRPLGT